MLGTRWRQEKRLGFEKIISATALVMCFSACPRNTCPECFPIRQCRATFTLHGGSPDDYA